MTAAESANPLADVASEEGAAPPSSLLEIGILTRGKATLGMVLAGLILQEALAVRIHVVDTSERPVISRDDVRFALRLAADRRVECTYVFSGTSERSFSVGKAKLIRALKGPQLCLMDDDIVMPSSALARLMDRAKSLGEYGFISPVLRNSPTSGSASLPRPQYVPGSLIFQDQLVRTILLTYYDVTTDVLDRARTDQKVWETAFLTELFAQLKRPCVVEEETVSFHLDYQERPRWFDEERTVISRSKIVARELIARTTQPGAQHPPTGAEFGWSRRRGLRSTWWRRARRLIGMGRAG